MELIGGGRRSTSSRSRSSSALAQQSSEVCRTPRLQPRKNSCTEAAGFAFHETGVVPGEFFERPQHFRIGFCGDTETLRAGLERITSALQILPHAD